MILAILWVILAILSFFGVISFAHLVHYKNHS